MSYVEILIEQDGEQKPYCAKTFGEALIKLVEKVYRSPDGEKDITSIAITKKEE